MGEFNNKVAIVTGAGGIGRAVAELFAAEGGKVVVVDLPAREPGAASAAERAVEAIHAAGGEAVACHIPIGPWASGEQIVQTAMDSFGRLDVLVGAAGNLAAAPLVDVTEEEWDALNNVHLKGEVSLMQAAAKRLIAQGDGGSIINFSSRAAFLGPMPAYAAAKAGVLGLTTSAAMELAPHGINVNAILPSAQTSLFPGDASTRPTSGGTPFVADIDPAALAPAVLYLATAAGAGITGRWVYAAGNDVAMYHRPFELSNQPTLLRGNERWTLGNLAQVLPSLLAHSAS
ncbi:SDR family NAD(P)-dependent oxidoreductase [Glaciibacter sp. 2TAF33]|uniref:SDR family NAD(P)-dependent oxidoreductase n=1 Tax=Glaciibacter sp. 2TAF33 TaxID=3233015 RepID=UPI003F8E7183